MANSTADATAANADTLKRELKKTLAEIFSHGGDSKDRADTDGSFGVLKAIDEAIRILTFLREVESKKPESDLSSSSPSPKVESDVSSSSPSPNVEVPKEFKCTLSNKIMIEPVVIASGQTYEKRYITDWLAHERKCPKSNEVLSHCLWTPNHSVDELITQWCRANKYDRRLKPSNEIVAELSFHGIRSLLQRISIPSSVNDQTEAAKELRCQTKKFPNVRNYFSRGLPGSITRLLNVLSVQDKPVSSHLELQENIVTALFNISIVEDNKAEFAGHPPLIRLLTKTMRQGTDETRRYSAATLLSLSAIDSIKTRTDSELLEALKELIRRIDLLASLDANFAALNLCLVSKNLEKAVSVGLIAALVRKIEAGHYVAEFLSTLALFSTHKGAIKEMEDLGFIKHLFSILRKPSTCLVTCENALSIVFNICCMSTPHENRVGTSLTVVDEEEIGYGTFTKLTKHESDAVARKAQAVLRWLKMYGTGKHPQME